MIHVNDFPRDSYIAVSGGCDSMAALSFLTNGKRRIAGVVTINHQTDFGNRAEGLVVDYCSKNSIPCHTHSVTGSSEEEWRDERKKVFAQYSSVLTAHHLDDVVEWWLMTSFRGNGRLIPWRTENVYHPFLGTRKSEFTDWCARHEVPFLEDPTNSGDGNDRAKLRALMPGLLEIYPGIYSSILKKITQE